MSRPAVWTWGERVRFRNLLSEFAKDRIVVISTHIVSDVEYIANQNAIMKDGKIIENDTTEHLVHLVDGKIWECQIPSADLGKWERVLKIINLRNEDLHAGHFLCNIIASV